MSAQTNNACVVLCTCPDSGTAQRLAQGLLEKRLAACVNVLPGVCSYYHWKGELQADEECQMVIKTTVRRLETLTDWLNQAHPYELPEILAVPVVAGLKPYLDWIEEQTREHERTQPKDRS